jgi:hypothetical protein
VEGQGWRGEAAWVLRAADDSGRERLMEGGLWVARVAAPLPVVVVVDSKHFHCTND